MVAFWMVAGGAAVLTMDMYSGFVVGTGLLGESCPSTAGETQNATDARSASRIMATPGRELLASSPYS
jgi:hypothetical protein